MSKPPGTGAIASTMLETLGLVEIPVASSGVAAIPLVLNAYGSVATCGGFAVDLAGNVHQVLPRLYR